jgi:hypothetical protein
VGSIHKRRFLEALKGWIMDEVTDEALDKEFERRFKESASASNKG